MYVVNRLSNMLEQVENYFQNKQIDFRPNILALLEKEHDEDSERVRFHDARIRDTHNNVVTAETFLFPEELSTESSTTAK